MSTQLVRAKVSKEKVTRPEREGLAAIVQRLIERANEDAPSVTYRELDGEAHELFLDLEVDGVRCLLARMVIKPERPHVVLSPREREISRMVAKGHANKTIAAVLEISSWTVCTYLRRIFAKLGVSTRAAMVARLLEEGLLKDHSPPTPGRPRSGAGV